jgi:hypothetical protein
MLRRHKGDSNKAKITTLESRLWSWVEVEDSKLNSKDALSGWRVITELATTPQKYREIYLSSRSSRLKPSSFLQLHGRLVDKYDCGWGWRFFADSWHYTQGTTLALKHLAIQYPSFELLLDSDEASSQRCLLALLSLETREILHLAWYTGDKMMDILAADVYRANNLYYLQLNNIETATGGNYDAPFTVAEFSAVCAACPKLRALSCVLPDQNIFADRRNLQSGP